MIQFTLPNCTEFKTVNHFFYNLSKLKAYMFKEPVKFIQVSGGIPYCYWTGSFSTMHGKGLLYNDFIALNDQSSYPIRLIFDNIALEDFDYDNTLANVALDCFHTGSNCIEISNLTLMDNIQKRYPNYNYIFSAAADLITPFTPELLNTIIEQNQFSLIGMPDRLQQDEEFLKAINNRRVLEIKVNPSCKTTCRNYNECRIAQHCVQLDFSNNNIVSNCYKSMNYENIISLEKIKEFYLPLGINHFTFENFSSTIYDESTVLAFYIDYFILPEYQYLVLKAWNGKEAIVRGR